MCEQVADYDERATMREQKATDLLSLSVIYFTAIASKKMLSIIVGNSLMMVRTAMDDGQT